MMGGSIDILTSLQEYIVNQRDNFGNMRMLQSKWQLLLSIKTLEEDPGNEKGILVLVLLHFQEVISFVLRPFCQFLIKSIRHVCMKSIWLSH